MPRHTYFIFSTLISGIDFLDRDDVIASLSRLIIYASFPSIISHTPIDFTYAALDDAIIYDISSP